ncbi:MAG: serine/threonine protein kinase [Burkholderiales bacterium]|nr:serine/threonine protein kinase [Burkholderiales bacterium]
MTDTTKLGKFEIRRELGKGAMGVVYEGYDPMIDRTVAIKTIRAENLQGEDAQEQLARFRREAQAAGKLTHPNVVSIYDFGQDGDTYFIAMEFVKGRELQDILTQNERFGVAGVVQVMTQLLEALDYSHRHGVVHRDIKPANIILLEDGTVKVADFGIARVESSNLTQAGMVLGTPSYMSPEQFMGQTVDGRSDLFSAGVILYQLLTGEKPFTGSVTTIMHKVLQEQPLPPSKLNVQVPLAFDGVVQKALAKRPEDRFQTGREFAAAIRSAAAASSERAATDATLVSRDTARIAGDRTIAAAQATQAPGASRAQKPPEATQRIAKIEARTAPQAAATGPVPARRSLAPVIAVAASIVVIAAAGAAWFLLVRAPGSAPSAQSAPAAAAVATAPAAQPAASTPAAAAAPAVARAPSAAPPAAPPTSPGTVVVTALGLADPTDARYKDDQAALQAAVRADSRSQAVVKALGLYVQQASLAQHYDKLRDTLLAHSGDYIASVVQESAPQLGKDGLMYVTTQAVVKTKELQKSLNQMSREERIDFIRNNGDPKISVRVAARDADRPDGPSQPSTIAENMLKERIKTFGFRTWSDDTGAAKPDFAVDGEARIKKLTAHLQASGLNITKYTLTSWTVKCTDRDSGEEIYFNNTLPKGVGSWATEEEALRAIGDKIADEFSRDFFLQHFGMTGQKVVLRVTGLTEARAADLFGRELVGLESVLWSAARPGGAPRTFDVQLAGSGSPQELVAEGILKPINAKLGKACLALGPTAGEEITITRDPSCTEAAIAEQLESGPPAGLYAAPPSRRSSVVKNPATLKRLTI